MVEDKPLRVGGTSVDVARAGSVHSRPGLAGGTAKPPGRWLRFASKAAGNSIGSARESGPFQGAPVLCRFVCSACPSCDSYRCLVGLLASLCLYFAVGKHAPSASEDFCSPEVSGMASLHEPYVAVAVPGRKGPRQLWCCRVAFPVGRLASVSEGSTAASVQLGDCPLDRMVPESEGPASAVRLSRGCSLTGCFPSQRGPQLHRGSRVTVPYSRRWLHSHKTIWVRL